MDHDWLICMTFRHPFTNDQSRSPLDETLPPMYGRRSPALIINIAINDNKVYISKFFSEIPVCKNMFLSKFEAWIKLAKMFLNVYFSPSEIIVAFWSYRVQNIFKIKNIFIIFRVKIAFKNIFRVLIEKGILTRMFY